MFVVFSGAARFVVTVDPRVREDVAVAGAAVFICGAFEFVNIVIF